VLLLITIKSARAAAPAQPIVSYVAPVAEAMVLETVKRAWNQLNAFLNQVAAQRGKKLTNAQADLLTAYVQNILAQL
jgi:hypothetical protein